MIERTDLPRDRALLALLALSGAVVIFVISIRVFPYHSLNHDEGVYLQQAAMLLRGELFLRPPVPESFRPWFFVDVGEKLYPKYAPIPAAMFAGGMALGEARISLALIACVNIALVYGITSELFDGWTGLLGAVFVLASPLFLVNSSVFLPYAPTAMWNFLFAFAYIRSARTENLRWGALAGGAIGIAFFSRPFTAVLFALPFIIHTLWTMRTVDQLRQKSVMACVGLCGVAVALGYNYLVTGSPWVFPYEAFAPHDGLGFGHRELLNHQLEYTPSLALESNGMVLTQLFTDWVAGGLLGTLLGTLGLCVFLVRARRGEQTPGAAMLLGIVIAVALGNVYFWGNFNILGDLTNPNDGLIAYFGPYYHFDLLLPIAGFAAYGARWGIGTLRGVTGKATQSSSQRRAAVVVCVLITASGFAGASISVGADPINDNLEVTETYEQAYESIDSPDSAIVFLPAPYGAWLNHPFQWLRNDPAFEGNVVYSLPENQFAVIDAFENRSVYRYSYDENWAPHEGDPIDPQLQRVTTAQGDRIRLDSSFGIPTDAERVSIRVAAGEKTAYFTASPDSDGENPLNLTASITQKAVHIDGANPVGNETLGIDAPKEVVISVYIGYKAGTGFSYQLTLPIRETNGSLQALSPYRKQCLNSWGCTGDPGVSATNASQDRFINISLRTIAPENQLDSTNQKDNH